MPLLQNQTAFKLAVLLVLWAAAFIPVYPHLIWTWLNHSNNSHGILAPLISGFLVWQRRAELKKARISSSQLGLAILIISMTLYVLGYWGGTALIARAMIVFSLIGLVLFNLGSAVFSLIAFPLLYLLFMVPVPDSFIGLVSLPLQLLATKASAFLIDALSIPVYKEGNMLYFAHTQLEVAEACSGIRSLTSLLMLSVLLAYVMGKPRWKQMVIVLSAVPLAFLVNIVRVSGIGILAHFYGHGLARGFLHYFSGWAVFIFGFILLFGEYLLLQNPSLTKNRAD